MRSDFKIGIAVGLFVILVAVVYFIAAGGGDSDSPSRDEQIARDNTPLPGEHNQVEGVPDIPSGTGGAGPTAGTGGTEPIPVTGSGGDTIEVGFEGPETTGGTSPGTTDTTGTAGGTAVAGAGTTEGPREVTPIETTPGTVDTAGEPQPSPVYRPEPVQPTTGVYVVKAGDQGFWGIAENVYGDGKYFTLIARANPEADTNSLREGQRLVIPPLPSPARTPLATITPGVEPSGGGVYVVREGDLGFWGIAKKVYNDGKYFTLIARANPGVDPRSLRPGQRLKIPPKPTDGRRVAPGRDVPPSIPDARNIYVVQRGDNGFWDIAVKRYKNGKYWPVIARANPGVDPLRLKPGQKLNVPPLTETLRASAGRTGAPVATSPREPVAPVPAGGDERPYFGEYVPQ